MAAIANSPVVEDRLVHVFAEISQSQDLYCRVCKKGPAVYHWTEKHGGSAQKRDAIICRVCASMVVLVGKPT